MCLQNHGEFVIPSNSSSKVTMITKMHSVFFYADLALASVPECNAKQTWYKLADRINSKCRGCRGKLKSQKKSEKKNQKTSAGAQDSQLVVTE